MYRRLMENAAFDVRQRFSLGAGYELSAGRGKHFGSSWHAVVDDVLGGRQLNWIRRFQSGCNAAPSSSTRSTTPITRDPLATGSTRPWPEIRVKTRYRITEEVHS